MDEKIKDLIRRIFNLEKDNLVISYILYQVINYIWGK